MHIKVLHSDVDPEISADGLVRSALCGGLTGRVLSEVLCYTDDPAGEITLAVPSKWDIAPELSAVSYDSKLEVTTAGGEELQDHLFISNGRYAFNIDPGLLERIIVSSRSEIITVNVDPSLSAYRENYRFAGDNQLAGCRRLYSNIAAHAPMTDNWPHLLIVKNTAVNVVLKNGYMTTDFGELIDECKNLRLKISSVSAGGTVLDLETEKGFMSLLNAGLKTLDIRIPGSDCDIKAGGRIVGNVVVGKNVTIGKDALVVGPSIIGDNVTVEESAIVNSCVLSDGMKVRKSSTVQYRLLMDSSVEVDTEPVCKAYWTEEPFDAFEFGGQREDKFHGWRKFSYPVFLKRGLDIVFSALMLLLFAPVFVLVAIALKINSPGPLFYRARRQGLGGKEFDCLKFRTMIVDADKMQDNLRIVNQIDGPQFKMEDDPRISTVGRFLRETSIDEIPQFINVFFGQMSVVGPRPSPESENTLCPSWRDIRLSVRPGITGLWQVCRTREPSRDFQEWIHYDTKYVRNLSLKNDIKITWMTAKHMIEMFVKQF